MGTARVLVRGTRGSEARTLPEAMDRERERLRSLIAGSSSPDIFSAHLEMLDDPLLQETIESNIAEGMAPREAVEAAAEGISDMLSGCGDDYMAARADDVRDVCRLIQPVRGHPRRFSPGGRRTLSLRYGQDGFQQGQGTGNPEGQRYKPRVHHRPEPRRTRRPRSRHRFHKRR